MIMCAAGAWTACSRADVSKNAASAPARGTQAVAAENGATARSAVVASPATTVAATPQPDAVETSQASSAATSQSNAAGTPQPAATGPQIYSIATSPSVVHAGEAVVWDVRTTKNIVAVTAHVSAYTIPLHRTAPGRFALNFTVPPNVPGIFHGIYNLDVTARTETGAIASRTVTMSFQ